jgi:hypothetical protein
LARRWSRSGSLDLWRIGDVSWWERRDLGKQVLLWEDEPGEVVGFEDSDRHDDFTLALPPEIGWAAWNTPRW